MLKSFVCLLVHGNDKVRNSHEKHQSTSTVESTFVTHEHENKTNLIPISTITPSIKRLIKDYNEKIRNTTTKIMVPREVISVPPLTLVNNVVNREEINNSK